ncbi:MAG: DoxX family protein [Hyphomicrobiaceae bacterium]
MTRLFDQFTRACEAIPYWLLALLARLSLAAVFHLSFRTKVDFATWSLKPSTFYLFENEYALPLIPSEFAAYMATAAELVLPILLVIGLGTRLAALGLLVMTLVIQLLVYPGAYPVHGPWMVAELLLMKYGAGALSLDALLASRNDGRIATAPQS